MIWNLKVNAEGSCHAVEHYLLNDMTDAGLRLDVEEHALREVARGIAESYRGVLGEAEATGVHYSTITASISQALWTIGEQNAAFSYMERRTGISTAVNPLRHADRNVPAGASVFHMLSSQTVRAMSWITEDDSLVWVLDLNRLFDGTGLLMDMDVRRRVRGVLDEIAIAWEAAGGEGVFGLRNVEKTGGRVAYGTRQRKRRGDSWSAELTAFCRDVLRNVAEKRHWLLAPQVRCFDL